jgi:hypothetical protein
MKPVIVSRVTGSPANRRSRQVLPTNFAQPSLQNT